MPNETPDWFTTLLRPALQLNPNQSAQNLDGGRRSMYDPDEIEDEQREREKRNRINAEFQGFVKKVQEVWEKARPTLPTFYSSHARGKSFIAGLKPCPSHAPCLLRSTHTWSSSSTSHFLSSPSPACPSKAPRPFSRL